jgi:hypothetical protein
MFTIDLSYVFLELSLYKSILVSVVIIIIISIMSLTYGISLKAKCKKDGVWYVNTFKVNNALEGVSA